MTPTNRPQTSPSPTQPARTRSGLGWALVFAVAIVGCSAVDPSRLGPGPSAGGPLDSGAPDPDSGAEDDGGGGAGGNPSLDGGNTQTNCSGQDELDTCTRAHALTVCVSTECVLVECLGAFVDCDQSADNGCEATLTSLEHCGLCEAPCALPNAQTSCDDGTCALQACDEGYGDCDALESNGCETDLRTIDNCGTCTATCDPVENGAPGCATGTCGVGSCDPPYGDCDDDVSTGCEQVLSTGTHCGACDAPCAPANAVGDCNTGDCVVVSCVDDLNDCNGLPIDGCEASLESAEHCGACGAACELPHASLLRCDTTAGASCAVDHSCPEGTVTCTPNAAANGCEAGYADCNGVAADGCERRLDTLSDCGGCGVPCAFPGALAQCDGGVCTRIGCEPGFGQCGGSTDCESLASDPQNCGECGRECSGDTPHCYGGVCTGLTCSPGTADCNANATCETNTNTVDDCGLCGLSCGPFAHATAGCSAGECTIITCDTGFEDCDGVVSNGCEVDIRTNDTCGACDASCVIAGAQTSCGTGTCDFTQCNGGRADCNDDLGDGCETNITLPGNCGECGLDCAGLPHVLSGGCQNQTCAIICEAGYDDCDGDVRNGCETNLSATGSCGSCGIDCSDLPNVVSASCGGDTCGSLVCAPGFADCDGVTSNGCERSTRTSSDCGACNTPCAPSRGTGDCSSGTCTVPSCDSGFSDCNDTASDGCEASLTDPATCGRCDEACDPGWACENGTCRCTSNDQCPNGQDCCDGTCTDTRSQCSLWPCPIASTSRPLLHCGGCGNYCPPVSWFCCATAL